MAYKDKSQTAIMTRKARIFKVLDYDPDLTSNQLMIRFRISHDYALKYRKEWQSLQELSQ